MIYVCILSMIIYCTIMNIFTDYKYTLIQDIYFWMIGIFMFIIAALRDGIGYDYENYKNIFSKIKSTYISYQDLNIEKGYFFLNEISDNFYMVIIIAAIIGVIIKIIIINKNSKDKLISLLMYFTGIFMTFDMGVIRQGISISFGLISLKYIVNKDIRRFLFTIFLGSLFHISIIVFLPLYFMNYKIYTRKQIYGTVFITLILSIVGISDIISNIIINLNLPIISSKIAYYETFYTGDITISLIKRIMFLILFLEIYKRKNISDKYSITCLNGYFLSIVIMSLLSNIDILGGRGVTGLYFLQIFIFADIVRNTRKKEYKILWLLTIILLSINSMLGPIEHGNSIGQIYTPYKSILSR